MFCPAIRFGSLGTVTFMIPYSCIAVPFITKSMGVSSMFPALNFINCTVKDFLATVNFEFLLLSTPPANLKIANLKKSVFSCAARSFIPDVCINIMIIWSVALASHSNPVKSIGITDLFPLNEELASVGVYLFAAISWNSALFISLMTSGSFFHSYCL